MATAKAKTMVAILSDWSDGCSVTNWLMYGGRILRIYQKDNYDPRCGRKLPFFDTIEDVVDHFFAHGKKRRGFRPCQVAVDVLPQFSFKKREIKEAMQYADELVAA